MKTGREKEVEENENRKWEDMVKSGQLHPTARKAPPTRDKISDKPTNHNES